MELVSRTWKSVSIDQRLEDGYFNGTAMCRACGARLIHDYLRSNRFASYRDALAKHLGSADATSLVHVAEAGSRSGTWVHPRIAIDLARWLCPEFAVSMDAWFIDHLTKAQAPPPEPQQPSARPTPQPRSTHQMQLMNETDLHYRVVRYLRRFHPTAVFLAGLGELQDTEEKRLDAWAKGYLKGQPDLLLLNRHRRHAGLALEFKTPAQATATASPQQAQTLERLGALGFRTLLSNDYDVLCREIDAYLAAEALHCSCCSSLFASERALEAHKLRKRLREVEDEEEALEAPAA
jgi:hypothetical protein